VVPQNIRYRQKNDTEPAQGNMRGRTGAIRVRKPIAGFGEHSEHTYHRSYDCENLGDVMRFH